MDIIFQGRKQFQAQGPGSRIALVGHSMGGRIAMQSGPWCLTHLSGVKTCYMGCDQKSHIDHIGNLDKHHVSNFWCSVSEYFWYFWNGSSTDPWVHPLLHLSGDLVPSGAQVRGGLSGRSELAGDRGYGDPSWNGSSVHVGLAKVELKMSSNYIPSGCCLAKMSSNPIKMEVWGWLTLWLWLT